MSKWNSNRYPNRYRIRSRFRSQLQIITNSPSLTWKSWNIFGCTLTYILTYKVITSTNFYHHINISILCPNSVETRTRPIIAVPLETTLSKLPSSSSTRQNNILEPSRKWDCSSLSNRNQTYLQCCHRGLSPGS